MVNLVAETANTISVLEKKIKKYDKATTHLAKVSVVTDVFDYLLSVKYKPITYIGTLYFLGRVDNNAKKLYKRLVKINKTP